VVTTKQRFIDTKVGRVLTIEQHFVKRPEKERGRPGDPQIAKRVSEMLLRIEREGADAVRAYSRELDGWDPDDFRVSEAEIERASASLDDDLLDHIAFAQDQVRGFAELQRATMADLERETVPGVVLGHRHVPVGNVGSYVPGGRMPMLASSFMTVIVPKVAGVDRVTACAPPRDAAGVEPAMLHAMSTSGADAIFAIGGVQALAAMAFGIEDMGPVDMLVGAGNAYVAEAKRQLFGRVGIDLLAGPTEILIIADDSADPAIVAADLIGQAEHGPTSPAVLVTTSEPLAEAVLAQIDPQLEELPSESVAADAWRDYGAVVLVANREAAAAAADDWAPEHLEVQTRDDDWYLARLRNYGSLFVGASATVAYSDKAIGTNHVLPTGRAARYTGGLWVGRFLKTVTYQRVTSDEGARLVGPPTRAICHAEHMWAHAITVDKRLERLGGDRPSLAGDRPS
jgi:sulfopropanediol 3-dehydrogenase